MANISDTWTLEEAAHLLNRAGFGGSPDDIESLHRRGRRAAVEWLLTEEGSSPPAPKMGGKQRELFADLQELRSPGNGLSAAERDRQRTEIQRKLARARREDSLILLTWWMERMRTTGTPLQEKMVFFWHDHFASSTQKVRRPDFMFRQNELFRKHATGNFGALVKQVVTDPAMMLYLDSAQSNKKKPNENFARELLELFTLGVGNYTEDDIKEAARAFTGYRLNRVNGEVTHRARAWDEGEKQVLGAKGAFDGDAVVELILKREACAGFIAKKVFEYFAYENPSPQMVAVLGACLKEGDYALKPLLRTIFLSEEFYSPEAMRTRIKSPVEFLIMLCKQLEVPLPPDRVMFQILEQLGQVPFLPPNVAGWDWGKAWINTNTLITRYHVAGLLTGAGGDLKMVMGSQANKMKLSNAAKRFLRAKVTKPDYERIAPRELREDPAKLVSALGERFFHYPLQEKDRKAFVAYAESKKGVIFTNTEVAELIHLMLSTPSYQLA
ncbi:MAG: DUF1800 domain-containing protein [Verrucomicrobiota bacterium JB023]|nr:DUF1800 domain-containing protein [Verrucomicrobiota bacterium JB023]